MSENKERVLTYEVQTMKSGRWEVYSRFPADAKHKALEEAKELEKNKSLGTIKVIKEVYNSETRQTQEFTVYKTQPQGETPTAPPGDTASGQTSDRAAGTDAGKSGDASGDRPRPVRRSSRPPSKPRKAPAKEEEPEETADQAAARAEAEVARAAGEEVDEKPPASILRVFLKLLLITGVSVGLALLLSFITSAVLPYAPKIGVRIDGESATNLVFAVFVLGFLLTSVPMAIYFLSKENLNFEFKGRRPAPGPEPPPGRHTAGMSAADRNTAEKQVARTLAGDRPKANGDKPRPEKPKYEMPSAPKEPPPLSPFAEKQKTFVLKFLGDALANLGTNRKMDNYNKFGINLFLAGACEALSTDKQLDVLTTSRILAEGVQVLGFKKHQAQGFADKYQDYLLADSRYMQMFQAGRSAMEASLGGEAEAEKQLDQALGDWNKPKKKEEETPVVTVLFTDLAGSTAMTQNLGDAGAQEVVRAHNAIVRKALSRFRGKEIKHTGDGIMASFNATTDGVKAAVEIQKGVKAHNKAKPDLPLGIKIGLHSGQAIAEDDDLFGTHVQLAARIVDKAAAGEILLSETAHGICAGKGIKFVNRGQFTLKGFSEPQSVYQVDLGDGTAKAAPETAGSKAEAEAEAEVEAETAAKEAEETRAAEPAEATALETEAEAGASAEAEPAAATLPEAEPEPEAKPEAKPRPEPAQPAPSTQPGTGARQTPDKPAGDAPSEDTRNDG